jgi:hypothetical protein
MMIRCELCHDTSIRYIHRYVIRYITIPIRYTTIHARYNHDALSQACIKLLGWMSGHDDVYFQPPVGGFGEDPKRKEKNQIAKNVKWLKTAFGILFNRKITSGQTDAAVQAFRLYWRTLPGEDLPKTGFKPSSQTAVMKMPFIGMVQIMYAAIEWATAQQGFESAWLKGKPDLPQHLQGEVGGEVGEEEEEEELAAEDTDVAEQEEVAAPAKVYPAKGAKRTVPEASSSTNLSTTNPTKKPKGTTDEKGEDEKDKAKDKKTK